jgi:hypothetical protein
MSAIAGCGFCAKPVHDVLARTIYDFRTRQTSVMRATANKGIDLGSGL